MPRRDRGRGSRLTRRWLGFQTGSTLLGLTSGSSVAVELLSADTQKDTILRTRGQLTGWVDGLSAPGKSCLMSVGMWIVPEGTGTTILADPSSDANADWFYYTQFILGYEEMAADAVDVPRINGYREVIDDKAMRIGPPDTEVQMVFTNTLLQTGVTVNLNASGRFLLGR